MCKLQPMVGEVKEVRVFILFFFNFPGFESLEHNKAMENQNKVCVGHRNVARKL